MVPSMVHQNLQIKGITHKHQPSPSPSPSPPAPNNHEPSTPTLYLFSRPIRRTLLSDELVTPGIFEWKDAMNATFHLIDSILTKEFRFGFSDQARLELEIPKHFDEAGDLLFPTPINALVEQTLYYITGYLLKAMKSHGSRQKANTTVKAAFDMFVATHEISHSDAKAAKLPVRLILLKSDGSLHYPSNELYRLVCYMEHAYHSLLTLKNIIVLGSDILAIVDNLIQSDPAINDLFQKCMVSVREEAAIELTTDDETALLKFILDLYLKLRGKDFVKTLLSIVSKSVSLQTLTTRAQCNAAASFARQARADGGGGGGGSAREGHEASEMEVDKAPAASVGEAETAADDEKGDAMRRSFVLFEDAV